MKRVRDTVVFQEDSLADCLEHRWRAALEGELLRMDAMLGLESTSAVGKPNSAGPAAQKGIGGSSNASINSCSNGQQAMLSLWPNQDFASPAVLPAQFRNMSSKAYRHMDGVDFAEPLSIEAVLPLPTGQELLSFAQHRGTLGFEAASSSVAAAPLPQGPKGLGSPQEVTGGRGAQLKAGPPKKRLRAAASKSGASAGSSRRRARQGTSDVLQPMTTLALVAREREALAATPAEVPEESDGDDYADCFAGAGTVVSASQGHADLEAPPDQAGAAFEVAASEAAAKSEALIAPPSVTAAADPEEAKTSEMSVVAGPSHIGNDSAATAKGSHPKKSFRACTTTSVAPVRRRRKAQSQDVSSGPDSEGSALGSDLDDSEFDWKDDTANVLLGELRSAAPVGKQRRHSLWSIELGPGLLRIDSVECVFASAKGRLRARMDCGIDEVLSEVGGEANPLSSGMTPAE